MTSFPCVVAKSPIRTRLSVRRGASALEYAIVAFLVLILAAILSMGLLRAREAARDQLCVRRLVLLARATSEFSALEGGYPGYVNSPASAQVDDRTWVAAILPLLDERLPLVEATAEGWKIREQPGADPPLEAKRPWQNWKTAIQRPIAQLICPNEDGDKLSSLGGCSYVANCGYPDAAEHDRPDHPANGLFLDLRKLPPLTEAAVQSLDGTDFTMLFSENVHAGRWDSLKEADIGFVWTERLAGINVPARFAIPDVLPLNHGLKEQASGYKTARPSSRHAGGVHAVFANSRASKIASNIDPVVYIRLCTVDDGGLVNPWSGEPIGQPIGRADANDAVSPKN